jgi:hypothetical protein
MAHALTHPWPSAPSRRPPIEHRRVTDVSPVRFFVLIIGLSLLSAAAPFIRGADDKSQNPVVKTNQRKDKFGLQRQEAFVERAKKGDVDVLFLVDSITQGWEGKESKEVWEKEFGKFGPANFGIGGDRTEHLKWRITEGKELEGIRPKTVVLMIGTNNMGPSSELGNDGGQILQVVHLSTAFGLKPSHKRS